MPAREVGRPHGERRGGPLVMAAAACFVHAMTGAGRRMAGVSAPLRAAAERPAAAGF
jgi:hypothetical protein